MHGSGIVSVIMIEEKDQGLFESGAVDPGFTTSVMGVVCVSADVLLFLLGRERFVARAFSPL